MNSSFDATDAISTFSMGSYDELLSSRPNPSTESLDQADECYGLERRE